MLYGVYTISLSLEVPCTSSQRSCEINIPRSFTRSSCVWYMDLWFTILFQFSMKKKNADYAENSGMENKSFNSLRHFLFQHDQNATASQKPCSELCFDFDKARWYFLFILNLWKSVLKKTGFIRGMKAYKSFLPVTRYAANPTETQLTIVLKSEVSNLVVCSWIGDLLFYLIHRKHQQ